MVLPEAVRSIPPSHPIHGLFRRLTERGLTQVGLDEGALIAYLSEMLVRFVHIDALYRLRDAQGARLEYVVDMIQRAEESDPRRRRDVYRHIGDFTLFMLGFYPEKLRSRRSLVGPDYYAEQGRRSYGCAAAVVGEAPPASLLRRLSEEFEACALGLHWVREYTHDPFYRYMLAQFGL